MNGVLKMDEKTKIKIGKEYLAGRYNEDIMQEFNITKADLYKILAELKIPRKVVKAPKQKTICQKCGFEINIKNFKYCPECGTRILTKQTCLELLEKIKDVSIYIPESDVQNYLDQIETIKRFIADNI